MVRAHDLETFIARRANGREVIFRIDEVPRRRRIEIPRANAAHDRFRSADEQTATLSRRLLARMRKHVSDNIRWHSDTHHEKL